MGKRLKILLVAFLLVGFLYFLFMGLTGGKDFLKPFTTAIILSMVMSPIAYKLKGWGITWGLAVFLTDLVLVLFIAFMIFLLAAQANQVADNWPKIESRIKPKIENVQDYLNDQLNLSISGEFLEKSSSMQQGNKQQEGQQQGQQQVDQQQGTQQQQEDQSGSPSFSGNIRNIISSVITNVFSFIGDMLLILVYIFFFTFYQKKFEDAIIGLVPNKNKEEAKTIISRSARSAQQYLLGRLILIAVLAVLYMAGFTVIGLEYAIFISLLAALFALIPYIGNIIGFALAIIASFVAGGGTTQIILIAGIFTIIQFIENYMLEPYIVGGKVDLNPVTVIVGVVLGGIVWGVIGMILAIPILAIISLSTT